MALICPSKQDPVSGLSQENLMRQNDPLFLLFMHHLRPFEKIEPQSDNGAAWPKHWVPRSKEVSGYKSQTDNVPERIWEPSGSLV